MTDPLQLLGQTIPGPEVILSSYPNVSRIVFAAALGLLLGTEREWAQKPAGMRTFTIITTLGAILVIIDEPYLLLVGGLLIVIQGSVFAVKGMVDDDDSYLLTTSVSMVLAFGVGILIGQGQFFEGVFVTVFTTFVLVLRRELHGFARNLSKDEIRSAIEFAILAFVIYPLLPDQTLDPWHTINPRTVWILVVAVSGIGFANYLIVQRYGTRGIAITSFFGGLVNSTAVIGEIVSRTRSTQGVTQIAVGAILLANAAMALRDFLIAVAFIPDIYLSIGIPLGGVMVAGIAMSYAVGEWDVDLDLEFDSPFHLFPALKFGLLFLGVLVVSAIAQSAYGSSGFLVSSFFSGLISSGAVTTSVVLLVQSGQLSNDVAAAGIVTAVSASILVKLALVVSMDRKLIRAVAAVSGVLIGVALAGVLVVHLVV